MLPFPHLNVLHESIVVKYVYDECHTTSNTVDQMLVAYAVRRVRVARKNKERQKWVGLGG